MTHVKKESSSVIRGSVSTLGGAATASETAAMRATNSTAVSTQIQYRNAIRKHKTGIQYRNVIQKYNTEMRHRKQYRNIIQRYDTKIQLWN